MRKDPPVLSQRCRQRSAFEDGLTHLDQGPLQGTVFGLLDEGGEGINYCEVGRQQRGQLARHDCDILRPHPPHHLEEFEAAVALRRFCGLGLQQLLGKQAGLAQFHTRGTRTVSINDALSCLAPGVQGTVGIDRHGYSLSCVTRSTSSAVVRPASTLRAPACSSVRMPRCTAVVLIVLAFSRCITRLRTGSSMSSIS